MKIIAFDLGESRTGVAVCDSGELLASPLTVVFEKSPQKRLEKLAQLAVSQQAEQIVVGLPVNMDGSHGARAELCKSTAQQLEEQTGIPTVLWDERRTTVAAHEILNVTDTRGKKRKQTVDAVAAVMILETYLAYRQNHRA